jgi:hypothetical protein
MNRMSRLIRTATALAVLAAGFTTLTALAAGDDDAYKPALPVEDYAKLTESDIKSLKDVLGSKLDKKGIKKAKAAAMMVALYAQAQVAKGDVEKGALRDAAVAVYDAVAAGKADEAKKLADGLATVKGKGKEGLIPLHKHMGFELADLMSQFGRSTTGGLDLEKNLVGYAKKTPTAKPDLEKVAAELAKIAAIGQYTQLMPPTFSGGMKTKANWDKWSIEMTQGAAEATAVAKGGKGDLKKALGRTEKSCSDCHNVFRAD